MKGQKVHFVTGTDEHGLKVPHLLWSLWKPLISSRESDSKSSTKGRQTSGTVLWWSFSNFPANVHRHWHQLRYVHSHHRAAACARCAASVEVSCCTRIFIIWLCVCGTRSMRRNWILICLHCSICGSVYCARSMFIICGYAHAFRAGCIAACALSVWFACIAASVEVYIWWFYFYVCKRAWSGFSTFHSLLILLRFGLFKFVYLYDLFYIFQTCFLLDMFFFYFYSD